MYEPMLQVNFTFRIILVNGAIAAPDQYRFVAGNRFSSAINRPVGALTAPRSQWKPAANLRPTP